MAIPSLLRARRSANRPTEQTQQVVLFCLRERWFALSMDAVKRVESFSRSSSLPDSLGQSALFGEQTLPLISAAQRIFREAPTLSSNIDHFNQSPDCFLIIVETSTGKAFGLTISSSPKMQRVSLKETSTFLPEFSEAKVIECVSKVLSQPDGPQILLLEPDLLYQKA